MTSDNDREIYEDPSVPRPGGRDYWCKSCRWRLPLTVDAVLTKWGIELEQLMLYIANFGLIAYDCFTNERVSANLSTLELMNSLGPNKFYFLRCHIEEFESEHQELRDQTLEDMAPPTVERAMRKDQRHKERTRAIAELIWQTEPNLTIADMCRREEILNIACERKTYKDDTIRDWIKDLCPNRYPGRRRNHQ